MKKLLGLTPDELLDKEFKVSFKGYDAEDVDRFLDRIITDYKTIYDLLDKVEGELKEKERYIANILRDKDDHQNARLLLEQQVQSLQNRGGSMGNMDFIKRLSRMEEEVQAVKNSVQTHDIKKLQEEQVVGQKSYQYKKNNRHK